MKNLIVFLALISACNFEISGQGILRGKVTDENGEPLIGANVVEKTNITGGTVTDFDGNYSLKITGKPPQVVQVSYISYKTVESEVNVTNGKVSIENFILPSTAIDLEGATVIARANREKDTYMRAKQLEAAVSMDFISKETISKTGDSYVDDAIKRVTGVSVVTGFITVRGLSDRYVKTTINGARIPTLDPLTNNIKLDILPTSLIDNIVITKTQSPDLPGDWTGAYISVETKDYPQKLMVNVKSTFGYNQQTTFKDVLVSERGPTDWLGYDDGYRDIDHSTFSAFPKGGPSNYQLFTEAGIEDYLISLGIKQVHVNSTSKDAINYGDIYRKLGLIKLGILAPGDIHDEEKYINAWKSFRNPNTENYQNAAYKAMEPASKFGQSLPNTWFNNYRQAPVNYSQDISVGNQINLFGQPLGFIAGLRYSSSVKNDPGTFRKQWAFFSGDNQFVPGGDHTIERTEESYSWSGLLNASYKFSPYHSVSLLFMPNFLGVSKVLKDSVYYTLDETSPYYYKDEQYYEERKQIVYQFRSEHYVPAIKLKMNLNVTYSDGESSIPDYKDIKYNKDSINGEFIYVLKSSLVARRQWRYLDEDILDSHVGFELPLFEKTGLVRKIKFGGAYQYNWRNNNQYVYDVSLSGIGIDEEFYSKQELIDYYSTDRFAITKADNGWYGVEMFYRGFSSPVLNTIGENTTVAGYALIDYSILPRLRFSGGLRVEHYTALADIKQFHDMGIARNDSIRFITSSDAFLPDNVAGLNNKWLYPSDQEQTDYLPSFNLIFKLVENENATINSRFNYSKTVARPSVREITRYVVRDLELGAYIFGEPDLMPTKVDNYDIRLESYFQTGEFAAVSFFYKEFQNHIEMINLLESFSWSNAESGKALGIEIEGKKKVLKNFGIAANVTFVDSRTKVASFGLGGFEGYIEREMFGQAPYVLNGLIDYSSEELGISMALSYNWQGPKIAAASGGPDNPDIMELSQQLLDFKVSKTIGEHFSLEFKARNLLNEPFKLAYKRDNYKYEYKNYSYGINYNFSVLYKL